MLNQLRICPCCKKTLEANNKLLEQKIDKMFRFIKRLSELQPIKEKEFVAANRVYIAISTACKELLKELG